MKFRHEQTKCDEVQTRDTYKQYNMRYTFILCFQRLLAAAKNKKDTFNLYSRRFFFVQVDKASATEAVARVQFPVR